MEKKLYNQPAISVSRIGMTTIICASNPSGGDDTVSYNPEFSGNPEDAI